MVTVCYKTEFPNLMAVTLQRGNAKIGSFGQALIPAIFPSSLSSFRLHPE
ncbi:hypothetical protein CCP3SC1_50065 [Gammaproteobacteria bacterium]